MGSDLVCGHRFSRGAVPGAGCAGGLALGGHPLVRVYRTAAEGLPHLGLGGVYHAETVGLLQVHFSPLLGPRAPLLGVRTTFVGGTAGSSKKRPGDELCGEPRQGSGSPRTLLRPSSERFYSQPAKVTRFRDRRRLVPLLGFKGERGRGPGWGRSGTVGFRGRVWGARWGGGKHGAGGGIWTVRRGAGFGNLRAVRILARIRLMEGLFVRGSFLASTSSRRVAPARFGRR